MKTKIRKTATKKPKTKATLEMTEKKVDIQMKRLELKNDKIDIEQFEPRRIALGEQNILIQKVGELRLLLSFSAVDEEKTIFGSEPMFKNILDQEEKKMVKAKLRELINEF